MRSDQLPPTIDTVALTTWSAAHISGTYRALPAASVSLSSRNASVELPSVKSARTSMNAVNDARERIAVARTAPKPLVGRGADERRTRRRRLVHAAGSAATAIAPGMIVSANSVRYASGIDQQKQRREQPGRRRRRGDPCPVKAVHLPARASASPTSPASRRAARRGRPFPRDRATRTANTCVQPVASAMSGRTADDTP